jgi:hypothetical protein
LIADHAHSSDRISIIQSVPRRIPLRIVAAAVSAAESSSALPR